MQNENKPKAMMFDLDGTLARSKQAIESDMSEPLSRLTEIVPVAIISGGKIEQLKEQVADLMPLRTKLENFYLFPTSGASFFIHQNGIWKKQYEHTFSEEEKNTIFAEIIKSVEILKERTGEDLSKMREQIEDRDSQITFSALGQHAKIEDKEIWDPEDIKRKIMKEYLDEKISFATITIGGASSLDITKKGFDKAFGVRKFAEYLKIKEEEMIYVGDKIISDGNDFVVTKTRIKTVQVNSLDDTRNFIKSIIE